MNFLSLFSFPISGGLSSGAIVGIVIAILVIVVIITLVALYDYRKNKYPPEDGDLGFDNILYSPGNEGVTMKKEDEVEA